MNKSIDLIQPRHSYAQPLDSGKKGHVYTNTSLWTMGALLDDQGVDIKLYDENIMPADINSNIVGINLLGAPYVPEAKKLIEQIRKNYGNEIKFLLGGQVLTQNYNKNTGQLLGFTDQDFYRIFGENVFNGMKPGTLEKLFDISSFKSQNQISLIPMYDKLSDELFLDYFSREISLYISQGCVMNCSFCAAVKGVREQYRDWNILYDDIDYLVNRLQGLGKNSMEIYMSNLDVFQSPQQLEGFIKLIELIKEKNPGFDFSLRALAQTSYFLKLHKKNPNILHRLRQIGFYSAGYGIDGMAEDVRKGVNKPQNNEQDALDTIRLTKEEYDITPELLMVFGHDGIDTQKTLEDAYKFVEAMVNKYGAIPRPHISKPFIPGNDGWNSLKYENKKELLLQDPELFQSLDFTALANSLTHDDPEFRKLVNYYYLEMCKLKGNTTLPIIPYEFSDSLAERQNKRIQNYNKFDR